jgi:hypothetical protein
MINCRSTSGTRKENIFGGENEKKLKYQHKRFMVQTEIIDSQALHCNKFSQILSSRRSTSNLIRLEIPTQKESHTTREKTLNFTTSRKYTSSFFSCESHAGLVIFNICQCTCCCCRSSTSLLVEIFNSVLHSVLTLNNLVSDCGVKFWVVRFVVNTRRHFF